MDLQVTPHCASCFTNFILKSYKFFIFLLKILTHKSFGYYNKCKNNPEVNVIKRASGVWCTSHHLPVTTDYQAGFATSCRFLKRNNKPMGIPPTNASAQWWLHTYRFGFYSVTMLMLWRDFVLRSLSYLTAQKFTKHVVCFWKVVAS